MRKMIESGYEWLGSIPSDWSLVKAKYVFTEEKGKGNQINTELLSPTQKYGVIPQSLYQEITGMTPTQISESADLNTFKTIHSGDFCISLSSYMGGFEFSMYEGVVSPAYQVFRKKIELDEQYFKLLFKSVGFIALINMITPQSVRVGRNTPFSKFGECFIPIPPTDVQKQISHYLNAKSNDVQKTINNLERQIEILDQMKRSIITNCVLHGIETPMKLKDSNIEWLGKINDSWSITKLKYHVDRIGDGLHGTPNYDDDGEYIFVNGGNLNGDFIRLSGTEERVSEEEFQKYNSCLLNENTVLIALNGANYGNISYYHGEKILLGKSAGYITLQGTLLPRYVGYYLMSTPAREFMRLSLLGTTIPNLSLRTLNNFIIPLPSIEAQRQIIEYLDRKCAAIEAIKDGKRKSISLLENYRNSLIQMYITGKKEVPA